MFTERFSFVIQSKSFDNLSGGDPNLTSVALQDRFLKKIRTTPVLGKRDVNAANQDAFQASLIESHSAVLGASALILAWPYEVPRWLPELLLATANKFSTSRAPVSTTVKDLLAQFRKTHQGI